MRLIARLTICGCVVLSTAVASQAFLHREIPKPDRIELAREEVVVPMGSSSGRPVVEVTLDGKGPYKMVLDTGASGTVLSLALLEKLHLPVVGEARVGSPLGPVTDTGKIVHIGRVEVGGVSISGMTVVAMDLSRVFREPDDPVGVLSAALFSGYLVTLDYPGRRIVFHSGELPPVDGQRIISYDTSERLPRIHILVAGLPVNAHVDTGSKRGLVLPSELAQKLPLSTPLVDAGKVRTVDAEIPLRTARLDGAVTFGSRILKDPVISFADGARAGNIGYEILGQFAITLDIKNQRIRVE
jgi:predicted aspartyl protease